MAEAVGEGVAAGAEPSVAVVGLLMLVLLPSEKLDIEKDVVPGMADSLGAGVASAAGAAGAAFWVAGAVVAAAGAEA